MTRDENGDIVEPGDVLDGDELADYWRRRRSIPRGRSYRPPPTLPAPRPEEVASW